MIRNPRDLVRYNASERANHWVVGICFILLALSGLAFLPGARRKVATSKSSFPQ